MKNNYLVTELRELNEKKKIIYLEGQPAFSLYNREVKRFHIQVNCDISEEQMQELREKILFPRAKERALNLLTASWKTSEEIFRKLREGYYPKDICQRVIAFLEEYGYLNDYEYVSAYVREMTSKKSIRKIEMELRNKGISEKLLQDVLEEQNPDEGMAILKYLRKKNVDLKQADYKERSKIYAALFRRGYSHDAICLAMENSLDGFSDFLL